MFDLYPELLHKAIATPLMSNTYRAGGPTPQAWGRCWKFFPGFLPIGQVFLISVLYKLPSWDRQVTLWIKLLHSSVFALEMADSASFLESMLQFASLAGSNIGIREGIDLVSCVTLLSLSTVVAVWVVTETVVLEKLESPPFTVCSKRSCNVLRLLGTMGSLGVVPGLLSLALSDCVSVRILPPSLIAFIRFNPSGFSCCKEKVRRKWSVYEGGRREWGRTWGKRKHQQTMLSIVE